FHAIALALLLFSTSSLAGEIPDGERRSGYSFMARDTRAMQDDDTSSPDMLFVLDGEALWNRNLGAAGKHCSDCHGNAKESMKDPAARYPPCDKTLGRPVTLEQRINLERTDRQQAAAFPYESHDLLALSAFIANQSRGMPVAAGDDPALKPFVEQG